ncbi:MAG: EscU/YscU/HrcU family type III secretion system export apparatus switch protein, partial [Chromatiales bacterium]|nr:EscU/YscU/HrcU family type III secretion system export apparatus switch protein [Chromatiales bacterium]
MAEKPAQERTEQATPKRLQQAREKGQIARSRELTTAVLLLTSGAGLFMVGGGMISSLLEIMRDGFQSPRADIMEPTAMLLKLEQAIADSLFSLLPFFALVCAAALLAPMALGGWAFSTQAISFKWDKLDPIKGLARVFSARGLIELIKALAKFSLVLSAVLAFLWFNSDAILGLGNQSVEPGLTHAGKILLWAFVCLSASLIVVAVIDVPFQLWDHQRQLRMTRQEIRDEFRETDGNPEVKRKVRAVHTSAKNGNRENSESAIACSNL